MMNDKDFDNKFRQAFDGAEMLPPEGMFSKIASSFPEKKKRRFIYWKAAAVIVAVLGIGGIIRKMQFSNIGAIKDPVVVQKPLLVKKSHPAVVASPRQSMTTDRSLKNVLPKVKEVKNSGESGMAIVSGKKNENIPRKSVLQSVADMPVMDNEPHSSIAINNMQETPALVIETSVTKPAEREVQSVTNTIRERTALGSFFRNIKEKVTSVAGDIVETTPGQTTVNLGFVAITKYKN